MKAKHADTFLSGEKLVVKLVSVTNYAALSQNEKL